MLLFTIQTDGFLSEKDDSSSPWPDAQPCRSPAMAVKHCVWRGASPAELPKKVETTKTQVIQIQCTNSDFPVGPS